MLIRNGVILNLFIYRLYLLCLCLASLYVSHFTPFQSNIFGSTTVFPAVISKSMMTFYYVYRKEGGRGRKKTYWLELSLAPSSGDEKEE